MVYFKSFTVWPSWLSEKKSKQSVQLFLGFFTQFSHWISEQTDCHIYIYLHLHLLYSISVNVIYNECCQLTCSQYKCYLSFYEFLDLLRFSWKKILLPLFPLMYSFLQSPVRYRKIFYWLHNFLVWAFPQAFLHLLCDDCRFRGRVVSSFIKELGWKPGETS